MKVKLKSLEEALAPIKSGVTLAIGGNLLRRQPNAAVHQLIRNGVKDLTVMGWASTTAADLLAAAGALRRLEGVYAGMFAYGLAPNIRRGVEEGRIEMGDFSESSMVARYRAVAQGLAFLPVRAMVGTDMARVNPEQIKPIACPFTGDPLHAVAAARSDFTIIHGYAADRYGNVQWPVVRDTDDIDSLIASAAKRLIITVEKIIPDEQVRSRPALTYIPGQWVESVVEVPYGAHPTACDTCYNEDEDALRDYIEQGSSAAGVSAYLDRYVYGAKSHDAYLEALGGRAALEPIMVTNSSERIS